ncbi:hypothetical protein [Streptomyces clavuligerus]|nr:hypothetical protein [Streptomyces clavuligerus]WDN54026.1 hypothetical protein LL058_20485 [Streptomyces clavuligerus]
MRRALSTGGDGAVVVCSVGTERALVARGLIHPVESTLTEQGMAVLAQLQDPTTVEIAAPRTAADLPKGTRVVSSDGRTGTVNGVDVGRVTNPDHRNCGREYVGVELDPVVGMAPGTGRTCLFVDELTIGGAA